MLVVHTSDTHSYFPTLPKEGEFIIHSGDFLPNCSRGNREKERRYQTSWLASRIETIKTWLDGRPFLFCPGNHEFINNVCEILSNGGIEAIDLTNKFVQYKGYSFYGFPYVPFFGGEWNYELTALQMNEKIDDMINKIEEAKSPLDILVCHCPPWGVLDLVGWEHIGNTSLTNTINYNYRNFTTKWILSGHCHESGGQISNLFGIPVSNAATKVNLIRF